MGVHALGIRRPVIMGHSFGGFVALQLALSYPDLVDRLILVNTAADMAGAMDELERRQGAAARVATGVDAR